MNQFLPTNKKEMQAAGWERPDFVLVTGDAYIDHPSFGAAIISRFLESHGYRVAILAQPAWKDKNSFTIFGRPALGFLITSGNIDSMVNHYTAAKKKRGEDLYSPGGKTGMRPDRAAMVYSRMLRQIYSDVPLILGGMEVSLRRLAHYDYWDNKVRRSLLLDAQADLLIYGMGERQVLAIARALEAGIPVREITDIPGTVYKSKSDDFLSQSGRSANTSDAWAAVDSEQTDEAGKVDDRQKADDAGTVADQGHTDDLLFLPDYDQILASKKRYAESVMIQHQQTDALTAKKLVETYRGHFVIQNPPQPALTRKELDQIYGLPYQRTYHPKYEAEGGIPAIREVQFSLISNRGCFGSCNFCALTFHQGRVVQSRSRDSLLVEARQMVHDPGFKGYIHDVGGPTANFRHPACQKQLTAGSCQHRQCLYPEPCPQLEIDHRDYLKLLEALKDIPEVKKVFIRSGIRYDYLIHDPDRSFFEALCRDHVSGQLKVAPEHISPRVLAMMGKPGREVFEQFVQKYESLSKKAGKEQFIVPYLMSGHPGSGLDQAIELAEYLRDTGRHPEQVQDFYPTPGTLSTAMYYSGLDPRTMEKVYVPVDPREKAMQRALMQYRNPQNYKLVYEALVKAGREDLIGTGKKCLIRPPQHQDQKQKQIAARKSGSEKPHGAKKPAAKRKPKGKTGPGKKKTENNQRKHKGSTNK